MPTRTGPTPPRGASPESRKTLGMSTDRHARLCAAADHARAAVAAFELSRTAAQKVYAAWSAAGRAKEDTAYLAFTASEYECRRLYAEQVRAMRAVEAIVQETVKRCAAPPFPTPGVKL